jgi:hypothetical protein
VPAGSISSLLRRIGAFDEAVIRKYTRDILEGLAYLHANGVVHRCVHPLCEALCVCCVRVCEALCVYRCVSLLRVACGWRPYFACRRVDA